MKTENVTGCYFGNIIVAQKNVPLCTNFNKLFMPMLKANQKMIYQLHRPGVPLKHFVNFIDKLPQWCVMNPLLHKIPSFPPFTKTINTTPTTTITKKLLHLLN